MERGDQIGKRLRAARLARSLTQRELADLLECTTTTVSRYETGAEVPQRGLRRRRVEQFIAEVAIRR